MILYNTACTFCAMNNAADALSTCAGSDLLMMQTGEQQ